MRIVLFALLASLLLSACHTEQKTAEQTPVLEQAQIQEAKTNAETVKVETAEKPATTTQTVEKPTEPAATAKPERVLDLSVDRALPPPKLPEQSNLLPNYFAEKKPETKRASVSGNILRKDDPNKPILETVEGAEVSIKMVIP